ncbi:hypothetical protein BGX29_011086, partial [Mortierella sp. GBA35]
MESDEIVIWMEDHSFNLNRAPTKAKKDLRTKTSFQSKKPLPYGYHEQVLVATSYFANRWFRQKIIAERIDFLENLGNNWETIKNEADETLDWMDAHPFNLEDEKAQEWDENDHYCRKWTLFDPKPKATNRGVWIKWEYMFTDQHISDGVYDDDTYQLGNCLFVSKDVNIAKTKIEGFKSVATHPGGSKARRGLTLLQEHLQKVPVDSRPRPEKGEHVMEGPNTKKSATHVSNPFQSETSHENDDEEDEKKEDAVTLFQEQGHHPLNIVFDYEAFAFSCIIGHYNILAPFNDYYEEAIAVPYDHNTFQDFL